MTTIQPAAPAALAAAAPALEGDVHQPTARHYTYGTDLDYVLDQLNAVDPIDAESEDPTDTDLDVHRALLHVRADILRRKAIQAGPGRHVDYCEVDGDFGRACGPDLGLPQCAYHGRVATLGQPSPLDEMAAALGLDEHLADDDPAAADDAALARAGLLASPSDPTRGA